MASDGAVVMVCYGVVWCGVVWCGGVWCGMSCRPRASYRPIAMHERRRVCVVRGVRHQAVPPTSLVLALSR